jgi:protein-tyrosine kinase
MNAPDNILTIEGSGRILAHHDRRIGSILVEEGKLVPGDIADVLDRQRTGGLKFGEAALHLDLITPDDLRRALAKQFGLPRLQFDSARVSRELVVAHEPFHPCSEEMRALRMQLLIRWSNDPAKHRTLAIVSPDSGEGRSYVAANLAVAFAQLGERTLLIDADLRKPRQHRIFDLKENCGLSAALCDRADRSGVIPIPGFGTLSLLPAGESPINPMELLARDMFAVLLRRLRADFDVVLLDTPPVKRYADAQSVAFHAGSVLVLARQDHTRFTDSIRVIRELRDTGLCTVYTALNVF